MSDINCTLYNWRVENKTIECKDLVLKLLFVLLDSTSRVCKKPRFSGDIFYRYFVKEEQR